MRKRKYIWFVVPVVLIVLLVIVIGRSVFVKKEAVPTRKTPTELEWLSAKEYRDTTKQHMGNLTENYQILEDYILYLEESEPFAGNILYKVDKKENKKTKLFENVACFCQQGDELYYSSFRDSYTELSVYNMLTGENRIILDKEARMEQVLAIDDGRIFYLNYDGCIMECKSDGTKREKCMKYSPDTEPFTVVKGGDTLCFYDGFSVTMISLKDKTEKKCIAMDNASDCVMVGAGSKVYVAIGEYKLEGRSEKEPVKSKWNGLWEIDMVKPYNMRKISDVVPSKLYWRDGMLYDENFHTVLSS